MFLEPWVEMSYSPNTNTGDNCPHEGKSQHWAQIVNESSLEQTAFQNMSVTQSNQLYTIQTKLNVYVFIQQTLLGANDVCEYNIQSQLYLINMPLCAFWCQKHPSKSPPYPSLTFIPSPPGLSMTAVLPDWGSTLHGRWWVAETDWTGLLDQRSSVTDRAILLVTDKAVGGGQVLYWMWQREGQQAIARHIAQLDGRRSECTNPSLPQHLHVSSHFRHDFKCPHQSFV